MVQSALKRSVMQVVDYGESVELRVLKNNQWTIGMSDIGMPVNSEILKNKLYNSMFIY